MDLSIFFAGTAGSVPSARRGLPAILIRRGGEKLLFDCGEGTQRQLIRSVGLVEIDTVFISHFHADHWLGLPGMLKSLALRERSAPLTIYGPPGLGAKLDPMMSAVSRRRLPYKLRIAELGRWDEVEADGYRVASIPVNHGSEDAYGYALLEDDRPGEFDPEAARRLGVTDVRQFGVLQRGQSVGEVTPEHVMGARRHGRRIVLSGDTTPCEAIAIAAKDAHVLVHEATFLAAEAERAGETFHSTATAAAELAREAGVELLALTHISGRYPGGEVRDAARAIFGATEVPRDFDTIEIPFPERGGPALVRWSQRRAQEAREPLAEALPGN
ncbi:MAG: ribonuclease Z [Solirubrobacteraceae bacterium]